MEAKAEGTLSGVEAQSAKYAAGLPDIRTRITEGGATIVADASVDSAVLARVVDVIGRR